MDTVKANTTMPTTEERLAEVQARFAAFKSLQDGKPLKINEILTCYQPLQETKAKLLKLAPTNIPILILGETGVGKELAAEALHYHSGRQGKFVAVNCGGIPDTLLETEFFGCVKGAFTGALSDRTGYIQDAINGTLFLDEIGDMPLLLQIKLLRFLQSKRYRRVGSVEEQAANVRIVSATNRANLSESPKEFRLDLYYRLAGSIIRLPSLYERGMPDVELLLNKYCKTTAIKDNIIRYYFTPPTLFQHILKGNIRQLLNIIEEYNVLCQ